MNAPLAVSAEVQEALGDGRPVVGLETTLIAHGFPRGEGVRVGREAERRVRSTGAVPATVGVLDSAVRVGLTDGELERFAAAGGAARKVGPRDLASCVVQRAIGATTVAGTLVACRLAGIRFLATGGLGGVHRGFPFPPDVSADVAELGRAPVVVVCSGVKSLLDVPATAEALETLGIPLLGWRTQTLPRFYSADGGPSVTRVETAAEAARIAEAHWQLGRHSALVLARPPDESLADVEPLIERALALAGERGVTGQALTPFVLSFLHEESGGRTLETNARLIADNAELAGEVAVTHSRLG